MKLLISSGKLRKPKLLLRQIVGSSMEPTLKEGRVIVASGLFQTLYAGNVVVIRHQNYEKIKRIAQIEKNKIFVVGDNPEKSTDSRMFGWLSVDVVIAKVIWPRL